jgi:DNA polymerase
MTTLSIDIETYSSYDLSSCGVHKYTEALDFEVLMVAYSYGTTVLCGEFNDPHVFDEQLIADLQDPAILKTAWNAAFERTCLSKWLGVELPPEAVALHDGAGSL